MASIDFSATSSMYLFNRAVTRHLPFPSSLTKPCILMQSPKLGLRFSVSAGIPQVHGVDHGRKARRGYSGVVGVSAEVCRENWLSALSMVERSGREENAVDVIGDLNEVGLMNSGECVDWTIGVDPDVKGAIALLKGNGDNCSAEVFDSPHLQVLVGKGMRRRLNAKAIVNLLRSLEAPIGTVAYLEQPTPFPKDGKQGWYSGGFGYGLWIGVLVASGFSVVPISSYLWKKHFELAGKDSLKDESRKKAIDLFPSLDSMLKRKKDHGRAEALLIAAYGKDEIPLIYKRVCKHLVRVR